MFYTHILGSYTAGATMTTVYSQVGASTLAFVAQRWVSWEKVITAISFDNLSYPLKLCGYQPCSEPNTAIPGISEGWYDRDLIRSEYCSATHQNTAAKARERKKVDATN
jgi:hypothetical protein